MVDVVYKIEGKGCGTHYEFDKNPIKNFKYPIKNFKYQINLTLKGYK